jgi:hypothetical protein
MKKIFIILSILLVYLSSCTSEVSNSSIKLFNSASFIRSEIVVLNKNKSRLLKTAEYNSSKEIFQLDTVNWNKEFEIIVASNISEKYLSYQIDTLIQNDSTIVTYTSKESKAEVRKFVVVKYNNAIANAQAFIYAGGHAIWRFIPFDHNRHQEQDCQNLANKLGFVRFDNIDEGRNRGTVYTRSNLTTNGVAQNTASGSGYDIGNNEPLTDTSLFRYVFNFGLDASTKAYATWNDVKNKAWAIDGIRHVFEPFIQASYIPQPNVRPSEFAGYDNRINTTESRPLNSTLYNSVDSIDKLLIVRPGMMNRILTKRDGAPYELANWKIYTDYQPIRPELTSLNFSTVQAPETVPSSIPELYNVLNFMPVPWWTGTVGATTAISGNGFNSLNLGSRWQVVPALELGLGYSYLNGFNYLDALNNTDVTTTGAAQTSLINGSANYRLNESWFANAGVTYSVSPSLLQQVNFGVYRDIGAWILGAQVGNRQNNGAPSEFVALATLTLKAFPDLPLGFNQNPNSSGVGLGGAQQTAGSSSP